MKAAGIKRLKIRTKYGSIKFRFNIIGGIYGTVMGRPFYEADGSDGI